MNDLPFEWIPGEVEEQAYVTINGEKYYVTPAQYAYGTSLSAFHLNKSEFETIKRLSGTVIYENESGTNINLVCSEDINNFDYLLFDFSHQGSHGSALVPIIDDKVQINSIGITSSNNVMQIIVQKYTIDGNTLNLNVEGMTNFSNTSVSYQSFILGAQATIKVKKITGFKRTGGLE